MVTADTEKEVRHRALDAGANDFFQAHRQNRIPCAHEQHAGPAQEPKQLANRAAWLAQEVKKALAEVAEREREAIFLLAKATEYRDPGTGAHILRMAHYSRPIGAQLGLPEEGSSKPRRCTTSARSVFRIVGLPKGEQDNKLFAQFPVSVHVFYLRGRPMVSM